ncbi:MAG: aldolase catalytic domain-containing protein [Dehalococcoidales bacterium]|jgi:4-hydroxy 2-oxovalerate aldolase
MKDSRKQYKGFEVLDCTIRDGGYLNDWKFDKVLVREVYRAVSKAGVSVMEIGFRGTEEHFDRKKYGPWRFSDEVLLREAVEGIDGAKLALMGDLGRISAGDFLPRNESAVDMVRIAANKDATADAVKLLEKIKKKGYKTSLNAMGYSNYTKAELKKFASIVRKAGLDYVYVVDSYGSVFPNEMEGLIGPLLGIRGTKVGFHPHNSLQMAFANTLEAVRCGADIVDSTFYGIGRGAGNLPTEIIVLYKELIGDKRYNAIPVLNCIDRYFLPMKKEIDWGYQLPFMLSGMYKCHPNYASGLINFREYTIDEICKAMEIIEKKNPLGYKPEILKGIIEDGHIGKIKLSSADKEAGEPRKGRISVPYAGRHEGRDFLVLANGPGLKDNKEKIEAFIRKTDPVILGANNLSGLFSPHYHAFNNKRRFMDYAGTVSGRSKLLISEYFPEEFVREYTKRDYEKLYYNDVLNAHFGIDDGVIRTNCRTISVLLIGAAIAMGAKRVFVAGMDGYLGLGTEGKALYYNESDEKTDKHMIIERHMWCQKFLEEIEAYLQKNGREGIHIITPTTYKAFYKSVDNYL